MLFFIREALITGWGRETYRQSLFASKAAAKEAAAAKKAPAKKDE